MRFLATLLGSSVAQHVRSDTDLCDGPWQTVYSRFRGWEADGTFDRILACLQIELDERGLNDYSVWRADSTSMRASRVSAGAPKKETRRVARPRPRALPRRSATKIHLVCEAGGTPLAVRFSAGQRHGVLSQFEKLMDSAKIPRRRAGRPRTRP